MASLNLSINGPSIRSSYDSVINSTKTSTQSHWALFSVQAPLLNAFQDSGAKESILKVDSTGSGELEELIEDFNDGRIQFAFVRVQDPNTGLPKYVLIAWCGGGVPERTKGYFTSHLTAVSKILHGYHVQITARSQEDLDPETIMKKVADASGAKYSVGGSGSASSRFGGPPPPVAKKPVYTPTSSSAANPLIAARNRRNDKVDEDGWGADAPQITRTQLEKVESAYKPTKVNLSELTKQHQPEPASRFASSSSSSSSSKPADSSRFDVIGGSYRPVGKVDISAIRAAAKNKDDDRPTIVKGAYEPVGKVDIAAIRAKARNERDDRPVAVKGAYEPVGKVDIAAIRANAQQSVEKDEPAVESPPPKSLADRSAAFSGSQDAGRLTSLPKPKVASKFTGASSFMGTKAPTPGGLGLGAVSAPKAPVVGSASRTFADQGGKTPAQLWAEKKAREGGGGSLASPLQTSPLASPLSSQKSGGEWKSGYKGKSWAPVPVASFGHAAVSEHRTGESLSDEPPARAEPPAEPSSSGGVSALRDRFKGAQPIGQQAPSASGISHHDQPRSLDAEEEDNAPPPPVPSASRPSGGFQLPGLPSRPRPVEEDEAEEQAHEREESPVRIAVPVARAPEPKPEPEPVREPTPEPVPIASRPVPVPTHEEEEPPAAEPEHHAAGSGQSALIQYSYEKAEDNEIDLVEGEYIANIEQVDEDWWMGTNSKGETGLFPSNYVELVGDATEQQHEEADEGPAALSHPPPPPPAAEPEPQGSHPAEDHPWAIAEYDYEAAEDNELSFPEGAHVTHVEFPDDDWWFGHYNGQSGLFPSNYVQLQQ